MDAIEATAAHFREWQQDYTYDAHTNEYQHVNSANREPEMVREWFGKATP